MIIKAFYSSAKAISWQCVFIERDLQQIKKSMGIVFFANTVGVLQKKINANYSV